MVAESLIEFVVIARDEAGGRRGASATAPGVGTLVEGERAMAQRGRASTPREGAPAGPSRGSPQPQRLGIAGYWSLFREGYDELVKFIIRPPRAEYDVSELGPQRFKYGGVDFIREDVQVRNKRGLALDCSLWRPLIVPDGGKPCVLYMHGNASCRLEALSVLGPVLSTGAMVFAFDFAACGRSEGEYISLGWFERDDVQTIVEHLRSLTYVTAIALWGRSMGAASAVMHAARDPSLAGLVLDSPFASLEAVAIELVTSSSAAAPNLPPIPPFLVKTALRLIASSVKSRAGFDLYKLRPVDFAPTCFAAALFATAHDDVLVRPHHSRQIYEAYSGDKNIGAARPARIPHPPRARIG